MSRRDEIFKYENFELGVPCGKKNEIADKAGVKRQTNFQEWSGSKVFNNCIPIFVTLDKTHRPKYDDKFDGPVLYWDSRSSASEYSPEVQLFAERILTVVLFARCYGHEPFIYCGSLKLKHMHGSKPVHFHWDLVDFPSGLQGNDDLDRLANWTKISSKNLPPPAKKTSKKKHNKNPNTKIHYTEGAKRLVTGNYYERDPAARYECMEHFGKTCWVCGFDFAETYGSMGEDFIFVHHRVPVPVRAQQGPYKIDPKRDLVPLCGNCHVIVHRKRAILDGGQTPGSLSAEKILKLKELQQIAALDVWEESTD